MLYIYLNNLQKLIFKNSGTKKYTSNGDLKLLLNQKITLYVFSDANIFIKKFKINLCESVF